MTLTGVVEWRKTPGRNLAELGLLLGKPASELTPSDASNIELAVIEEENKYRVDFIKEIIDVKHGNLEVDGFTNEELDSIVDFLCTS